RLANRANLETWISTSSDLVLAKGYLKVLTASWADQPAPKLGTEPVTLSDLWEELRRRNIVGANRQSIEVRGSLLNTLVRVKREALGGKNSAQIDQFLRVMASEPSNALIVMLALKRIAPSMTPLQTETFRQACEGLQSAVQNCEVRFSRAPEHDRFYAL